MQDDSKIDPSRENPALGGGAKYDRGKPRWDLLPWDACEDIVRVLGYGAELYGERSWMRVPRARVRYFAALVRHVLAWMRGDRFDADTGLPHLAHAGCCVLFLAALDIMDDDVTITLDEADVVDP